MLVEKPGESDCKPAIFPTLCRINPDTFPSFHQKLEQITKQQLA
jgi:hypothetical protein